MWVERIGEQGVQQVRVYRRSLPAAQLVSIPGWILIIFGIGVPSWAAGVLGVLVLGLAIATAVRGFRANRRAQLLACQLNGLDPRHLRSISFASIGDFDNRCSIIRRRSAER